MAAQEFSDYAGARWQWLVRSAVMLGCNLHEAKDIAQTTLLRCYVSWDKVLRARDLDAYVARVLINAHRQSRRRFWWREGPTGRLPDSANDVDATAKVDGTETVRTALRDLMPAHREVILLRFYMHMSDAQAADALGIPAGTVKSRLSRALQQLSANHVLADLAKEAD